MPGWLKVISGGQTGVDRAALDVALELGLPVGGWCPAGRRAEDGPLARRYPLQETASPAYPVRTRLNIEDSDGTLILHGPELRGGTELTRDLALRLRKPVLVLPLAEAADPDHINQWLERARVHVLNVAGPRASEYPPGYVQATALLRPVFAGESAKACLLERSFESSV